MSAGRAKTQPQRGEDVQTRERLEMLKRGVEDELGQLHRTNALLIAAQFAANHECEFDASDALAAIIARVDRHIETLDSLCLQAAR